MGIFEDSIRKSFEGKEVKAPSSAWNKVENELNADFVQTYQAKLSGYKWIAVAAMLIAILSFAIQYSPVYPENSGVNVAYDGSTYNALLANGIGFSTGLGIRNSYSFDRMFPVIKGNQKTNNRKITKPIATSGMDVRTDRRIKNNLSGLLPSLELVSINSDIYRYHQGGAYSTLSNRRSKKDERLWAGVQAGAGNFSSSLASSNVFAGSINQSNLATALGSDGFVNPSTQVNPDLNSGIATSVGVDLGLRLGDKWALETGIAYTNVDARGDATINVLDIYTIDNSEFFGSQNEPDLPIATSASRETSFEVQDSYDYDVDLRSNLRFTSIPVKAGYFLMDRKMSLRVNVGLAANYFMGSQLTAQNNVLNGSIDDSFNSWSFDGLGGVEIGYSILDNFDVTFEPNYRQSITPLTDANGFESRFLVQTGLKYRIK